ncbi:MerR family transcriptional regulator [Paenibacillus hemerocallicola]|uniref:MerR family transcriptional regulator n=1 Tax=Paenibacillus hemerocallicola TaxID=1172614 RepID=A0A5C4TAD6_9BACL|nr:MerR family transcriptional regulator [Paenibacillus hemerocallicola]TNJ65951.1 MerR family transcriptional regulator [Paenibacillus hemerocallicola]
MDKLYSIQEVSRLLGMPKDTLRYYDRIGIVSPSREDNRYRRYSKDDLIDLMNIQIMQYADFSLDEIRGKFGFHRMENITPAYCEEIAAFLDAKNAETRKKIAHLEKVSRLLNVAAETLRDFNHESDQRLAEIVREIYQDIRKTEQGIYEEECNEHKG